MHIERLLGVACLGCCWSSSRSSLLSPTKAKAINPPGCLKHTAAPSQPTHTHTRIHTQQAPAMPPKKSGGAAAAAAASSSAASARSGVVLKGRWKLGQMLGEGACGQVSRRREALRHALTTHTPNHTCT
jgi:hypothetical protein